MCNVCRRTGSILPRASSRRLPSFPCRWIGSQLGSQLLHTSTAARSSWKCNSPWNCRAWKNCHHLFPPGLSAWVALGCAVPLSSETWQAVLSCFIELFLRERQRFYFFFFFFKGVWRRSRLQSIIWSQIESSKTFQERMSPPLAWNSVVFVVSGSLPGFSEIAEHMQLCPNSLGNRDWGLLEVTPSLFNLSSSYWIAGGTKL